MEALNVLFESCRRSLYCRALRIVARPQDAEDVVQEAMLAAFTQLHRFQGRADFRTWATRIVINAALMHIRKARSKPTVLCEQMDIEEASFSKSFKDPQPTPEERLHELELRKMLEDAVHELPVGMRRAMQLWTTTDYSMKEAASALGLPVSTLKARLHRGRRALMACLKRETSIPRKRSGSKHSLACPAHEESLCTA
jgi:RNA polymerase sigma-70 factor (ECF subfamily)